MNLFSRTWTLLTHLRVQVHCRQVTISIQQNACVLCKPALSSIRSFLYFYCQTTKGVSKIDNVTDAGRLKEISDILNCSELKLQLLCLKHDFLYEINLHVLRERVKLILSYGLPYSVIHTHLRAVWYVSTETLAQRLELLQEHSLLNYKSAGFYLHCSKKELVRGLEYVSKNRQALGGCSDQMEYIQQRLNIGEIEAQKFLSSTPFRRGYSDVRLKNQLDFFLDEVRVSPEYLLKNFILLNYSVERLRQRLEIMESAGITNPHLRRKVWRYTPKEFNQAFAKFLQKTD